jgi:hypothetical protein
MNMVRLWLLLRSIRQRTALRSQEQREIEAYLRKNGAFNDRSVSYSWMRVLSGVVACVLVLCVSVSSYAYASEAVLPDTPLYPVREAIEQVQVALAITPVQKEKVEKKLEVRRQKEVEKMTELKRPVPKQLKKYLQATTATTTKQLLKKVHEQKRQETKEQGEAREVESRKKIEQRLERRFRLPEVKKQLNRQSVVEQRRVALQKRAEEHRKQQEAARQRLRTRTQRGR